MQQIRKIKNRNVQQTRKIKNRNVEPSLVVAGKHQAAISSSMNNCGTKHMVMLPTGNHQAAISSSMNNCGTKHRVMLPTSKLNSSDFQVSWASIFLLPLQERVTPALFKNVMSNHTSLEIYFIDHILDIRKDPTTRDV
jgi:hypothetical protein